MKTLIISGLLLSLSAFAFKDYAPNNGTARPGNPGTNLKTTDIGSKNVIGPEQPKSMPENTSVNPVPDSEDDLTLQSNGKYRIPSRRQSQEANEDELDYRTNPKVDHNDQNASGNN